MWRLVVSEKWAYSGSRELVKDHSVSAKLVGFDLLFQHERGTGRCFLTECSY